VPLDNYEQNLINIINHPSVKAQQPAILLVTPPPVDEYGLAENGFEQDDEVYRTAENTMKYAKACISVGERLNVKVLDIWGAMIKLAGWGQEGEDWQMLPGSRGTDANPNPRSPVLQRLLLDGM
jgi:hypothetical protein